MAEEIKQKESENDKDDHYSNSEYDRLTDHDTLGLDVSTIQNRKEIYGNETDHD